MSNNDERTLARPRRGGGVGPTLVSSGQLGPARPEPTSWNGISYDDMMRSLEDALPADDRPTLVGSLPTRPVGFDPVPVTQRMPNVYARPEQATTVAPVALPSTYVDLDGDSDYDLDVFRVAEPTPAKRGGKGFLIGATLGVLVAGAMFAWANPDARTSAASAANGARMHASTWAASITTKAPPPATPAVAAPIAAPVAAPVAAPAPPPVTTEAPAVPQMRAPTPPPARPAKAVKRADAEQANVDPYTLLGRGLGERVIE